MPRVLQTVGFQAWFDAMRDRRARARIQVRIDRLESGNPGDTKSVGAGVIEMRIHYGPGYRVYYVEQGPDLVIILAGGDKRSQDQDIAEAIRLARDLRIGE